MIDNHLLDTDDTLRVLNEVGEEMRRSGQMTCNEGWLKDYCSSGNQVLREEESKARYLG